MPQISVNDLKNGITLELDNGLFQVVEFQHVKPGKGGAFVRSKIRNVRTGAVIDKTFNAVRETGATTVAGGGGVLANRRLRAKLAERADAEGVELRLPSPALCTDNGAMIAAAATFHFTQGTHSEWSIDVDPGLRL